MEADFGMLLRVAVSLAVVLAVAVVVLKLAGRWLERLPGRRGAEIEILEVRPIDRQHRLAMVRARGQDFLIAFGGQGAEVVESWPTPPLAERGEVGSPALGGRVSAEVAPAIGERAVPEGELG